jgi:hypothetical protein
MVMAIAATIVRGIGKGIEMEIEMGAKTETRIESEIGSGMRMKIEMGMGVR